MFLFSHCDKMMQIGLIHCRRFSICFPCSLIWFVCVFFFFFSLSLLPPPPRVLLLLDLTFIPLKRLSDPPDRLLYRIIIFLPFLLFSACLPSSNSSLTYLFSLHHSHFLYIISRYFESAVFFLFLFFCVCIAIVLQRPGQSKFCVPLTLSHWRHCLKTAM